MERNVSRREMIAAAGAAAVTGIAGSAAAEPARPAGGKVRVVAVSCSPRKGKTTAAGLTVALEAAAKVVGVETELIELAGMDIPVFVPGMKDNDDFAKVAPKLTDPAVGGIIIGTPVYFGNMTSLCKAFLDHWTAFRKGCLLGGKVGGVLAVGALRNGGQELTIQTVQAVMMAMEMLVAGDGKPTVHRGATLWNHNDSVAADELGLATARALGQHVAEVALKLAGGSGAR